MRSTAFVNRGRATLGSLTPPVARLRRTPRMPALPIASRSLSEVLSSITRNPARGRPPRRHAEQRGRVVGAVDRGRDDHDALHVQRLVQRSHFLGRGQLGRVDAAGEEREFRRVRVDMGVAVAGAWRALSKFTGVAGCAALAEAVLLFIITPAAIEASIILRRVSIGVLLDNVVDCWCADRRVARRLQRSSSAPGVASPDVRSADYREK